MNRTEIFLLLAAGAAAVAAAVYWRSTAPTSGVAAGVASVPRQAGLFVNGIGTTQQSGGRSGEFLRQLAAQEGGVPT